jgi:hypothetical protein
LGVVAFRTPAVGQRVDQVEATAGYAAGRLVEDRSAEAGAAVGHLGAQQVIAGSEPEHELEAAFDTVFEHGSTLVVDLSETTFIDSALIGLLVSTQQRVEHNAAHHLAVVAPPGSHPRRILDMIASMLLPVVDDLPTAVATRPEAC